MLRDQEADYLASSGSSDGEFFFDKANGHRGAKKIQTKVTKVTLNQMDNTSTGNDVLSSLSSDKMGQEMNELKIVSPQFSSENVDTARKMQMPKGCLRKPGSPPKRYRKMRTTHFKDEQIISDEERNR